MTMYGSQQLASSWYVDQSVTTATPAQLLTMLYDRFARDLGQARTAMLAGREQDADGLIEHALDILTELLTSLDGTKWGGAGELARIYAWMSSQLIGARIRRDPVAVATVHELVMELGSAWHDAADQLEGVH
jgi:flagellar secretion chaperone FliS